MAKYKTFLIVSLVAVVLTGLPMVVLSWGSAQSSKMYQECLTWENATQEECSGYLD